MATAEEHEAMRRAVEIARAARSHASPNPWVGAVVLPGGFGGFSSPPGGPHAEVHALRAAGEDTRGATLVVTLEPCPHHGRTPPCIDAIAEAGVRRVVVGIEDPDPRVRGRGIEALRERGIDVEVGVEAEPIREQLAPYLKHRLTGRPWVVLKLAATMDGRIAARDGSSKWITGEDARADTHRLRAESDAVMVGAGTVRADDPALTVRLVEGRDPRRVVLGRAPESARVLPALELSGDLSSVLDELGGREIVQLLVEGGARVAHAFHSARLVDRYVLYLAPAFMGGDDGVSLFAGPGASAMDDVWRGRVVDLQRLGDDVRVDLAAA